MVKGQKKQFKMLQISKEQALESFNPQELILILKEWFCGDIEGATKDSGDAVIPFNNGTLDKDDIKADLFPVFRTFFRSKS